MTQTIEVTAKTVEDAVDLACGRLQKKRDELTFEVVEQPKKGFLGMGSSDAKIRVSYEPTLAETAKAFLETVVKDIGIENVRVSAEYDAENDEVNAALDGENLGLLIGHHGDVLDSLQYLAGLAANRGKKDFTRVTLDIENYREKRVETLRSLARRSAAKVKKNGRNVAFEPMNAYERRIIHSEIQGVEGVTTYSVGNGEDRRVVISLEGAAKRAPKSETKPKTPSSASKPQQSSAPKKTYIYNPERPPRQIVKAKSIEDINLADVEDTEIVTFE